MDIMWENEEISCKSQFIFVYYSMLKYKCKVKIIVCTYCGNEFSGSSRKKLCSDKCRIQKHLVHAAKIREKALLTGIFHGRTWEEHYYLQYKRGALGKEIVFALTIDEFSQFWKQPCHYCGTSISMIGIDRTDNNKGYVIENCVPCCTTCNKMKRDMEYHDFIDHCSRVSSESVNRKCLL